jgi:heme exporter protein A
LLQAEDLSLWRGGNCLFEHLSFAVVPGAALLVQGPNGAGKTTLLRVLCGLTRPESGRVLWQGGALDSQYCAQLVYSGHLPALKVDLTVRQNLTFCADASGLAGDAWQAPASELGLAPCLDLEVRYLSAGQKRRAALVRVLMSPAPAWILDEPFTNLDRAGQALVERALHAHLDRGGLAVVATHQELQMAEPRLARLMLGGARR